VKYWLGKPVQFCSAIDGTRIVGLCFGRYGSPIIQQPNLVKRHLEHDWECANMEPLYSESLALESPFWCVMIKGVMDCQMECCKYFFERHLFSDLELWYEASKYRASFHYWELSQGAAVFYRIMLSGNPNGLNI